MKHVSSALSAIAGVAFVAIVLYGATSGNINWTQIRSGDRHGTDAKGQSSDGTGTSGNIPKYDANGGIVDGGVVAANIVTSTSTNLPPIPLSSGTSGTLTGNQEYFICTGACTITVPVPAAGVQFCVANGDNVSGAITLSALGSSARYENTGRTAYGTAGTGTAVSGGAVGDKICIIGLDSTHYLTLTFQGSWTMS